MKTLTLQISDSIYEKVKNVLSLFPADKLRINEPLVESSIGNRRSYEEFEQRWAGFFVRNTT